MANQPEEASRRAAYAERSRVTQQHILTSAVEVLVESGYSGASTLRIQERAGVSRGRLLHQYPHRDALLIAAVQHIAERRLEALRQVEAWPSDPGTRIDAAIEAMWATYPQGYFWAATELWLAARYSEPLAEALRPREQALGASIREAIDIMFGADLASLPSFPSVREVLNSSMRGVALAYSFDPRDASADPHLPMWKQLARRCLGVASDGCEPPRIGT